MKTKKMKDLLTTVDALSSSRFYLVNGHGIVGFKSNIEFVASRHATAFLNDEISSKISTEFIKDLNDSIAPVLAKYIELAKREMQREMASENNHTNL